MAHPTAFLGGCLVGLVLGLGCGASAEVAIGQKIGELAFKDTWYLPRTLGELGERRAHVLVFTTSDCPLARRVLPRLSELADQYRDRGVQFLAINVSPEDDIADVAWQALEQGVRFPFVKDTAGRCVKALGVTRTPQVVVLDSHRTLRYRGRVNDQYRLSGVRPQASREDLQQALEDVLAGREVQVPETPAEGCLIPTAISHSQGPEPTYAQHIAALIHRHCVECHRPDTAAPFALMSYEQVARKAAMIAEVVEDGQMPPWSAHRDFGRFANARYMSSADRDTIIRWARGQRLRGDMTLAPPAPPVPAHRWTIGTPDLIVTDDDVQEIPATGFIDYRYLVLPYIFEHDTWIQQLEILPGNPAVMHHAIVVAQAPGEKWPAPPGRSKYLHGIVPGGHPLNLPQGLGLMIPAGWELALEMHYVTTGKPETDQVSVGLRYARGPIHKELKWFPIEKRDIRIPAGDGFYTARRIVPIHHDVTLIEALVHMHLRGKTARMSVRSPHGAVEPLLVIPNYSFDWQFTYRFAEPGVKVPIGSQLIFDYSWDNSTFNPYNPDPDVEVRWGKQTVEEMMTCFLFFTEDAQALDLQIDPATGRVIQEPSAQN
jgi:thiol-disulfide isomerase/thioredoxin/mono/diheme cytochrome c family protein